MVKNEELFEQMRLITNLGLSTARDTQTALVITNTFFVVGDWASVPAHSGSFSNVNIDTYNFFNKLDFILSSKLTADCLKTACFLTIDGNSVGLTSDPKIIPETPFSNWNTQEK